MIRRAYSFKKFLGPEVWRLFVFAVIVGLFWFAVESSFAYILQGFLSTIGLIPENQLGRFGVFFTASHSQAVLILIAFGFFRSVAVFLRYHYANVTTQAFIRTQRIRVLKYSLENAQSLSSSEAISVFNERVTESGKVVQNLVSVVNLVTAMSLFSILCLMITPVEFMIGMMILVLALAPIRGLSRVVGTSSVGLLAESRRVTNSMLIGLRNNFLLRVYGEVRPFVDSGRQSLERYESHYKRYSYVYCLYGSFPHFIGVLAVAIVTLISLKFLNTPPASILTFFYLFFRIAQSASECSALLNEVRVYLPALTALKKFNEKASDVNILVSKEAGGSVVTIINELRLDRVGFGYGAGRTILNNVSLTTKKGQTLLIRGESGTGKSTLLSIICGILLPQRGQVHINGIDLREVDSSSLRERIGYVGPEPYIIEGSLGENLLFAFGKSNVPSETEMLAALEDAQLDDAFDRAGITLDTRFNEHVQLSTGQKQRLALARAFLRKPEILILDEATANLDSGTQSEIIKVLSNMKSRMITVIVTHREGFASVADQEVVLTSQAAT